MAMNQAIKWRRIEAGHYYTVRWNDERKGQDQIHLRWIDGNWHLTVNGEFRGYFGLKQQVERRHFNAR
jgi:hypothetical protein